MNLNHFRPNRTPELAGVPNQHIETEPDDEDEINRQRFRRTIAVGLTAVALLAVPSACGDKKPWDGGKGLPILPPGSLSVPH